MIIGIGSDLANIERIAGTLDRFGNRFIQRCFTEREQAKAARRQANRDAWAGTFAKRWAAKEACAKALGTGLRMGVAWREMGVVNLETGQPTMQLAGGAAERLAKLTPPGMLARIHLTMTDDQPWAQAFVVIEAVAQDTPYVGAPSP
ncbi:MAG: holo-ACP synthase [Pseudomonadota bacterium]